MNGVIILYTSSYSFLHSKYLFVLFKDNWLYMFTDHFIGYYMFSCTLFLTHSYKDSIQLKYLWFQWKKTTDIACVLFIDSIWKCV